MEPKPKRTPLPECSQINISTHYVVSDKRPPNFIVGDYSIEQYVALCGLRHILIRSSEFVLGKYYKTGQKPLWFDEGGIEYRHYFEDCTDVVDCPMCREHKSFPLLQLKEVAL